MILLMEPNFFGGNNAQHDTVRTLLPLLLADDKTDKERLKHHVDRQNFKRIHLDHGRYILC